MRLLLRSGASPDLPNNNGKTPLSIARERGYHLCEELVSTAILTADRLSIKPPVFKVKSVGEAKGSHIRMLVTQFQ